MLSFSFFSLGFGLSHLAFLIPPYALITSLTTSLPDYCLNIQLLLVPHSEGPALQIQGTPSSTNFGPSGSARLVLGVQSQGKGGM